MTDACIPEGRRTAATWVAATGAFLLLAAAALFVAVRWDELPDAAKLGALTAVTGAALAGGRALRPTLPATGNVVFHLGAFLVPVDVAAVALRFDPDWRTLLVVEGATATIAFGTLAASARSKVLWCAAGGSVVALAAGVASVTVMPAPALVALAAVVAHLLGRERFATAWATTAGLAPVVTAAVAAMHSASGASLGLGVAAELGVAVSQPLALAAGAAAALVLLRQGSASRDLRLVYLAFASLVSGGLVSWLSAMPRGEADAVAAAAAFLAVEAVMLVIVRDSFWRGVVAPVSIVVEVLVAAVALPLTAGAVLLAPLADIGLDVFTDDPGWAPQPGYGAAAALVALGWLAAGLRYGVTRPMSLGSALRSAFGSPLAAVPTSLAAGAAVAVGTASPLAAAATFAVLSVLMASAQRPVAMLSATALAVWAPVTAHGTPAAAALLGTACAGGLGAFVVRQHVAVAVAAAAGACASVVVGWAVAAETIGWGPALAAAAFVTWLCAAVAGEANVVHGNLFRLGLAIPILVIAQQPATDALLVTAACALLLGLDAWRLGDELVGAAAGLVVQLPIAIGAHLSGFDTAGMGLVLCGAAVVEAGLAGVLWPAWRWPLVTATGASLVGGVALAATDPVAFGTALVVAGGIGVAVAVMTSVAWPGYVGGAVATVGLFVHLGEAGVTYSEPYVAPVALQLLLGGWHLRRARGLSSWTAYGPAIALFGGAALAERIGGGDGWHAIVAGGVGVIAVLAGGWFRLVAPLLLGTALLVAVTVFESLSVIAGVPTWAWLALGGSILLASGVALERSGTSPAEAGRRVAEVLADRFD